MAPTGRGGLRPYQPSKFQPFLIICLLVTVIVVGYNFWNLMKKNSVLLVEIGKIQIAVRRHESDKKDCSVQLAAVEDKRKQHESADREKEITLEDTRRILEDLKAEAEILRQNISRLLGQIAKTELRENRSRSECEQRFVEIQSQMQEACVMEKEKLQLEMNDQLSVMKKQLKAQYQETEHLDQMVQRQKLEPPNGNSKDSIQTGGNAAESAHQQPHGNQVEQGQPLPVGQHSQKAISANRVERSRSSNHRLRLKDQGNLTYQHSARSGARNFQRQRSGLPHAQSEQRGKELFHQRQSEAGRSPELSVFNSTEENLAKNRGRQLNREGIGGELRNAVKEEQRSVSDAAEPTLEVAGSDSRLNARAVDGEQAKFNIQRIAQGSERSNALGQRSEGQDQNLGQNNGNSETKEDVQNEAVDLNEPKQNYQIRQGLRQNQDAGRNLEVDDKQNSPDESPIHESENEEDAIPPRK